MKQNTSLQLEECLLRFMDQMELLEEKRERFNGLIEQGWFSISKARYAMGNKQVSALQYSSEIEPQICVHVRTLPNKEAHFQTEQLEHYGCEDSESDLPPVEVIGPQDEGVRRRTTNKAKNPEGGSGSSKDLVSKDKSGSESKGPARHQDPLKWFGILVPQSLRQAQTSFKQVIELSAEIATLQSVVMATRAELQRLMQQKQSEAEDGASAGTLLHHLHSQDGTM